MGLFPRNSARGPNKVSQSEGRLPRKRKRAVVAAELVKSKKAKKDGETIVAQAKKTKGLAVGSTVIGVVSGVFRDRLQVDLPCGQRGIVSNADAHQTAGVDLRPLYKTGQIIVGVVTACPATGESGKKVRDERFTLSMRCELFRQRFSRNLLPARNQFLVCYITSIEEHGATASFGEQADMRIFIKSDNELGDLQIGQIVYVTVEAVKKEARLIVCRLGRESRSRFLALSAEVDMTTLIAGQLVEVKISTVVTGSEVAVAKKTPTSRLFPSTVDALEVSLCRSLTGRVPRAHLHHPLIDVEDAVAPLEPAFPFKKGLVNKKAKTWPRQAPRFGRDEIALARVLSVGTDGNISISLLPHIVHFHLPQSLTDALDSVPIGDLIRDARVVAADKETGVKLISAPLLPEKKTGESESVFDDWQFDLTRASLLCSPKKLAADETPEFAISQLNVGEKTSCRVLNKNFCDGTFLVGLGAKAVAAELFCSNNLKVKQLLKAELRKRLDWGFYVQVSEHLQAKLNKEQLSDISLEQIPDKYKEGTSLKLRVLRIDPRTDTVQVTAKKSFLKMDDGEILKHMEPGTQVHLNDVVTCYVDKATDQSLVLRGFADFCGLLPFEDIARTLFNEAESAPVSSCTRERILSSKKLRVGATLRVRVHKIRRAAESALPRFSFSLDLDEVADASNDIDLASKVTANISSLEASTFEMRQRPSFELPFSYKDGEAAEELCKKALLLLPAGTELEGQVRYISEKCQTMDVSLWGRLRAVVHATETADDLPLFPLRAFSVDDVVRVRVKGPAPHPRVDPHLVLLEGTMRSAANSSAPKEIADLEVGGKYDGVITSVGLPGVYVAISSTVTLRIKRCYLSSVEYDKWLASAEDGRRDVEKLAEFFPIGSRCLGVRVLSVSLSAGLAEGTLKSDAISKVLGRKEGASVCFESIQVGDTLPAKVKAETSFGLFVTFENSERLDALCPKDEIRDEGDETTLETGDLVLVKVLQKDEKRRRIRVGLKSSYFDDLDLKTMEEEETLADAPKTTADETAAAGDQEMAEDENSTDADASESDGMEDDDGPAPTGLVVASRDWLSEPPEAAPSETDHLDKFLRQAFVAKKKPEGKETGPVDDLANERDTREAERAIARGDWEEAPQSVDDFERLVLIKPNDSITWIRYMAHYAELQDRVKAAEIAQRGIDRLDPSLRTERTEIWLAWLNLEYTFGSKSDQEALLARALQYNDPVKVYLHMISLLESLGRWADLDAMTLKMFKKQGDSKDLWIRYLVSLFIRDRKSAELKGALQPSSSKDLSTRELINETVTRCLRRLPKSTHIEIRATIARLEFKYGQPERARGLFASILDTYPKRTDIWNLLLDAQLMSLRSKKESKAEIMAARQVFMKGCTVDLRVSKAKQLYKRWFEFEREFGDAEGVAECKRRAEIYVQSRA